MEKITLDDLLQLYDDGTLHVDVQEYEGFSEIMGLKLVQGLDYNIEILLELQKFLTVKSFKEELEAKKDNTTYTFCVTGSLNTFKSRDELKNLLESRGHKVAGSVSKNTNYLVTNDPGSGSSKNKKAAELGVKIITEQELRDLLKL
jgi:DNA ligase (NAD+)